MKIQVTESIQCDIHEHYKQEILQDNVVRCYQVDCARLNNLDCFDCKVYNNEECNIRYELVKINK